MCLKNKIKGHVFGYSLLAGLLACLVGDVQKIFYGLFMLVFLFLNGFLASIHAEYLLLTVFLVGRKVHETLNVKFSPFVVVVVVVVQRATQLTMLLFMLFGCREM